VKNVKAERRGDHLLETVVVVGYGNDTTSKKAVEANEDLIKEAIRVIGILGKFIPAQKEGKPVDSELTIPIEFKLR
jgi:hypothetical protein